MTSFYDCYVGITGGKILKGIKEVRSVSSLVLQCSRHVSQKAVSWFDSYLGKKVHKS